MTDQSPPSRKDPLSSTARLPSPQSDAFERERRSEITRLVSAEFKPASTEVIERAVALILDGYRERSSNPVLAQAYILALEGISGAGIQLGVLRVLRGEAGLNSHFRPNPSELAEVCKFAERDLRLQRAAELRLELPPPPLEWEPSADERGRVGPMFDALRAKISVPGSTVSEAERRAARTRVEAETAARRAAKLAAKSEPPESGE